MKTSVKMALATGLLAVSGGALLAGASYADPGFGRQRSPMGMMGPMGHEMLRDIDANDDGSLSQEEIDAAVNGRLSEFDANKDGTLSLEEFQALWAEVTRPLAVRAFQFLDPNGDAAVSKAELDERFGAVVAHFDSNDDGILSPEDRSNHRRGGHWRGGRDGDSDE